MRSIGRSIILALMLPLAALCASGCGIPNLIAYPFAQRDAKQDVKAEHYLTAERLLILPYLGRGVEFESPTAGLDISNSIIEQFRIQKLGSRISVINPKHVARFQQNRLDWQSLSAAQIGREFKADKVLYLEISRYSVMEERSANLFRGRLSGHLQVVDPNALTGGDVLYETDVSVQVPDDQPIGITDISESKLRLSLLIRFGEVVVWKFCDHEEPRMGGGGAS